ncbi:CBF3D [Mytilus edulis]|uniref:SKP1 n=1 Tax=Mytilus edulis TaxID=6550 RepID=A0A8S3S6P1_MYTED|nr:CBF3D [Mytilus edulis]
MYKKIVPQIKLETYEKEVFEIDLDIAKKFGKLVPVLQELLNDDKPLTIKTINSGTLKKIITWCTYHKGRSPPPEDDDNRMKHSTEEVSSWDDKFLQEDGQAALFDLISAAHTLDIDGLLDVACKVVATMIKGKAPEEIRKVFNIKNDFTQQEEDQVRKENDWCED